MLHILHFELYDEINFKRFGYFFLRHCSAVVMIL